MLREVRYDFLKYVRVIRMYMALLYGIEQAQVEMLLYVYSMKYFTWDDIKAYQKTIYFGLAAFQDLLEKKLIIVHAEYKKIKGSKATGRKKKEIMYKISSKGEGMCNKFYQFIEKERLLDVSSQSNVLVRYSKNKRVQTVKTMMLLLNKEIMEKRANENYIMDEFDLDF